MWIKTSSKLPWHWLALVFCLYEFGSPDLKRCPSHFFKGPHLWPRQEPIRCCWHLVGCMWASCGPCCLRTSQGTQGQKGFWGIHQINRVLGGKGLSHISEYGGMRCVCVVYCNVVCLNMIWFLVLLDKPTLRWFSGFIHVGLKFEGYPLYIPRTKKTTCYFLTLEALWQPPLKLCDNPPNFFWGRLKTQRYPKIIFLPFFLSQRWPKEPDGASLTVDFFVAPPWRKRFNDLCGMDEMAGGVLTSWYWKRETKITCAKERIGFML